MQREFINNIVALDIQEISSDIDFLNEISTKQMAPTPALVAAQSTLLCIVNFTVTSSGNVLPSLPQSSLLPFTRLKCARLRVYIL